MTYRIEVQREIYTMISYIHSADFSSEDLTGFIGDVIKIGETFIEESLPSLYHVLITDETSFDFNTMFKSLGMLRQNRAMIAVRTKLNMLTILVGGHMQTLQFTQQMMSTPQYGGRPIAILPSLDMALESVRRDIAAHGIAPTPPAMHSA